VCSSDLSYQNASRYLISFTNTSHVQAITMIVHQKQYPRRIGSSVYVAIVSVLLVVVVLYSSTENVNELSPSFSSSLLEDCRLPTTTTTNITTTTSSSNHEDNSQVSPSSIGDKWSQVIDGSRPAMEPYRKAARNKLAAAIDRDLVCQSAGTNKSIDMGDCFDDDPFSDIEPFVPLAPPLIRKGNGENEKTIMDPALMKSKEDCLLYAVGISTDSEFEQLMAPFCTIHAFDCTITEEEPSVKDQDFAFHQICIGDSQGALTGTTWVKDNRTLVFNSLQEVMKDLGHDQIDYLKFDVEGSEWTMFESILELPHHTLPRQINFEMHTEGAYEGSVPYDLVKGKRRKAVNEVILRFLNVGYCILDIERNPIDNKCAEFTLLLM